MENLKNQIIELEGELLEAMKKGDFQALDNLLHDDLLFVIPTGQTVTKEIDLANLRSGNLKVEELLSEGLEVNLIEDCAVTSVSINLKGSYLDQVIDTKFKYIRTWKLLKDGNWKVIGGAGVQV